LGNIALLFSDCVENAIKWSNEFVEQQLADGMFAGFADRKKKAKKVTKLFLIIPRTNLMTGILTPRNVKRSVSLIKRLKSDPTMQDLVLTANHCYRNLLMNTVALRIIENQNGVALVNNTQAAPFLPNQRPMAEQSM